MIDIKDLKTGDIFSENSHYILTSKNDKKKEYIFEHTESKMSVRLTEQYILDLLKTANSYSKEVEVTKEDSKSGPGIRTIWENIHSQQVFTVCFKKQDKPKTAKSIAEEQGNIRRIATEKIEKAKKAKKSIADAYEEALAYVQSNPVLEYLPGEDRILKGYKTQFSSRDGRYDCMDIDIKELRPVNINTINWLVYDGVKYTVKDTKKK